MAKKSTGRKAKVPRKRRAKRAGPGSVTKVLTSKTETAPPPFWTPPPRAVPTPRRDRHIYNHVTDRWLRAMLLSVTQAELDAGHELEEREPIYIGVNAPDPNHDDSHLLRVCPVQVVLALQRTAQAIPVADLEWLLHPAEWPTRRTAIVRKYKNVVRAWPHGRSAVRFFRWDRESEAYWSGQTPTMPNIPYLHLQ